MQNKLIRDSIHGYIEIPNDIITKIVDTPVFQRLRQIEQTSMRALYPCAHHDRFVHSIGVYHLGKLAIEGLINNIRSQELYKNNYDFWEQYRICFELACLLHDCGHAPMSHSFEYGYLDFSDNKDCQLKKEMLIQSMVYGLNESEADEKEIIEKCVSDVEKYFSDPKKIVPHEMVSAILLSKYYRSAIKDLLTSRFEHDISPSQLAQYIIFMQRAILGLPYNDISDNSTQDCFKNCLISLLNGSFFDVDKLDYIVRDTAESGANNLSIDIPRILNSLTLVEIHQFESPTEVKDLELNNSVYFCGCNSSIIDKSGNSDCECSLNVKSVHLKGQFQGVLNLQGSKNTLRTPDSEGYREGISRFKEMTEIEAAIGDTCNLKGRFNGQIETLGANDNDRLIDGLVNARLSGSISGEIIGHINTKESHKIIYRIGYIKSALSVIEDTLIARNRLYLWIYAHNKVTFSDYLLRSGILRSLINEEDYSLGELEKSRKSDKILRQIMSIDDMFFATNQSPYYLLSDCDLINNMKINTIAHPGENIFAEQWLSRKHMHPVWKSYVEYNSFFANLTSQQRINIWKLLFDYGALSNKSTVFPNEANSFEYDNSILKKYNESYDYVWIKPSGFKLKELNVSSIYILLSDNSVKRLKDVMTQEKVTEQYVDESFFYLYTSERLSPDEKLKLISYLKSELKNMPK